MSKTSNGEYFDGLGVTLYEGRFAGAFDLSEEVGESMRYNDVAVFLVTSVVGEGTFGENKKTGEMIRKNKLNVVGVREIDAQSALAIEQVLGGQQQVPAPTITSPVSIPAPTYTQQVTFTDAGSTSDGVVIGGVHLTDDELEELADPNIDDWSTSPGYIEDDDSGYIE